MLMVVLIGVMIVPTKMAVSGKLKMWGRGCGVRGEKVVAICGDSRGRHT